MPADWSPSLVPPGLLGTAASTLADARSALAAAGIAQEWGMRPAAHRPGGRAAAIACGVVSFAMLATAGVATLVEASDGWAVAGSLLLVAAALAGVAAADRTGALRDVSRRTRSGAG